MLVMVAPLQLSGWRWHGSPRARSRATTLEPGASLHRAKRGMPGPRNARTRSLEVRWLAVSDTGAAVMVIPMALVTCVYGCGLDAREVSGGRPTSARTG